MGVYLEIVPRRQSGQKYRQRQGRTGRLKNACAARLAPTLEPGSVVPRA